MKQSIRSFMNGIMKGREHLAGYKYSFFVCSIDSYFENDGRWIGGHRNQIQYRATIRISKKKANCIFWKNSYTPDMQKMTINNANIRITENSYLIDTGELSTVDISVEAGVSFFYTFVPTQSGHYIRHIDIATGAFFYG